MRRSQKSQKTKKRRGGSWWWPFGSSDSKEEPPAVESVPAVKPASVESNIPSNVNVVPKAANVNAVSKAANSQQGNTTQVVNPTKGGMAPINMKEPMFYPTQRQLDWATTAGLPTKGGSRRNKKSKRKSRR